MRPLKLKLTAFGPYKKTEIIDFAELEHNRLFAISGNTGSGKTTIFDGICYVLYGSASGADRGESKGLRSDFAEDGTHTAVEMEFEIHNRRYRILRQMGHVKKGNKTVTGDRCEFFEIHGDGEKPCVERQIVSEINRRVEEILGLTQNQFSQIVMLPQGEFRKLLVSETDDKEVILRKIFKTEPYKWFVEKLKKKRDNAKAAFEVEQQRLDQEMSSIDSVLEKRESELFAVLDQDHYNVQQVLNGLEAEERDYGIAAQEGQTVYDEKRRLHENQVHVFHEAKRVNGQFQELRDKEQKLEELKDQEPVIRKKEQEKEQADRARAISGIEQQLQELADESKRKEAARIAAAEAKDVAARTLEKAEADFQKEQDRATDRETAAAELTKLEQLLPIVEDLSRRQKEKADSEAAARKAAAQLAVKKEAAEQLKTQLVGCRQEIGELENRVDTLSDKSEELNNVKEEYRLLNDLIKLEESLEVLERRAENDRGVFEKAATAYRELESEWLRNQAQQLAAQLQDGDACPVCGSTEHPAKAGGQHETGPSKEELDAERKQLDEKDQACRTSEAARQTARIQFADKCKETAESGLAAGQRFQELKKKETLRAQLMAEVESLKQEREALRQKRQSANGLAGKLDELENETRLLETEVADKREAAAQVAAVLENVMQSVPEPMRDLVRLKRSLADTEELKRKLAEAWKQAKEDYQSAKERHSNTLIEAKFKTEAAEEADRKRAKANSQFEEALEKSAFSSLETYQSAKRTETEIEKLAKEIQEYRQTRHTMINQVMELRTQLENLVESDLDELQSGLDFLKAECDKAYEAWNRSKEFGEKAAGLAERIRTSEERSMAKEAQLNHIADLHDVLRGQNGLKISFERYLQIEYLERILESANEQLRRLSHGQFVLVRSDRQEIHGRQSGLGLDVYDAYTGQTRDVKTLSGGEKFNASLCLALGMADVIQSFQGNVAIDTMFIDEGFGSLDEEALQKSIETLIDLQRTGRMIGVISHVQELKTAIPAILEVTKSKDGHSRTKFIVK
ncbi:AAA family ATPase [Planococcus lenghuensis]|uniref:Nuclease SbcCD subunit C n=1 Tax=Planococcus lenghuensis TaxID=2213202 RepID=A0A1Q2KUU0_9BACL|nr:SMC family ATPase [Planococcus lenghuensis]AQQ51988.1 hypothetical protein B0X71_01845 [Planococcus lenghuensis]